MSLPESFRDFQCPIRMFVTNLNPNSELCTLQLGSRFVDRSGSKMHILHRPNVSQPHRKGVDIICNILRSCGAVRPEFETYKRGREIKRLFKEASRESKRRKQTISLSSFIWKVPLSPRIAPFNPTKWTLFRVNLLICFLGSCLSTRFQQNFSDR